MQGSGQCMLLYPAVLSEWVRNKAGVKRELLDTVKARKLAYYDHTMRKQGSCLEKEIMQGTMPGARRRGRPRTAWMDNIKMWTGLPVGESIRMTEDRDKWRKSVHGVCPALGLMMLKNRTEVLSAFSSSCCMFEKPLACSMYCRQIK